MKNNEEMRKGKGKEKKKKKKKGFERKEKGRVKKKKIQKSLYYDVIINLFNLFSLFVYYYTHYIAYLLSYTYHQFTNLSIHLLLLLFLQGAYSTVM